MNSDKMNGSNGIWKMIVAGLLPAIGSGLKRLFEKIGHKHSWYTIATRFEKQRGQWYDLQVCEKCNKFRRIKSTS